MNNEDKFDQLQADVGLKSRKRGDSNEPITLLATEVLPLYTLLISTLESTRLNPGDQIRLDNLRAALRSKINWELDKSSQPTLEKKVADLSTFRKYERKQNAKIAALKEVRKFLADESDPDYFVPERDADILDKDLKEYDDDGLGKMYSFDPILTDDDDEVPRDLKYPHKRPPSPYLKKFTKKSGNFKGR